MEPSYTPNIGVGFLVKSFIDLRSKKIEINHNLFQQKKLESINSFFSNCASTSQMWNDIPVYDIFEHKKKSREIDEYVFPNINNLRRDVFELKIYFKENEHKNFELILDNMLLINSKLSEEYFSFDKEKNVLKKSIDFQNFRDDIVKKNELILKKISFNLRNEFN